MAHLLPLLLLLLVHFARLVTTNGANSSVRIKDAAHIHSFPFSLHRSTVITGTISTGQFNIHHANLEKSNTLDLLRIQVHLHNTTELLGISKPLLQVTCQHLSDFISFALPTKKGNMKDGVLLTGLDKDFLESHFDNQSVYVVILMTANSNSNLTYTLSVKIYDRSQYNIILHPPNFTRKLSGQKISAVMPIAFKVNISETPVQMLKISVRSNDDLCAFLVIQNYSNTFLNSLMIALKSSIHVTFTRKASLMLTTESPFHVLLMVQTDDRACNPAAPSREYDRVKKFDISFSNVKSSSLYPLIVMLFYCALAVILLASDHFMLLRLFRDRQAEADIPLIVFLDEDNSRASQIPSDQVISAASDFSNILVDNRTDEDEQNTVKSTSVQIAAEHRAVDTDTNEITLHWLNWNNFTLYSAFLPLIIQGCYTLLLNQLKLTRDNMNACYRNMECAVPLGPFHTFNHMYSNIGYLLFGIAFIVLIIRRYKYWKYYPHGYNYCPYVFFNIGLIMCVQAFLSAFYHICPNHEIFHIDTIFIEVILILLMVRFYFVRRGGISSDGIFQSIIYAISFHVVVHMLENNLYTFMIMLTSALLLLIALEYHLLFESILNWKNWSQYLYQLVSKDERNRSLMLRKLLLACLNGCNILLALLFGTDQLQTSYLTLNFIVLNTAGYLIYYIVCKVIHGEKVPVLAIVYIVVSLLLWIVAFYFFSHGKNDWTVTAAQNRALAEECMLFNYYDYHDIWHFISSLASFFSLLSVAGLDDDILISESDQQPISVF